MRIREINSDKTLIEFSKLIKKVWYCVNFSDAIVIVKETMVIVVILLSSITIV